MTKLLKVVTVGVVASLLLTGCNKESETETSSDPYDSVLAETKEVRKPMIFEVFTDSEDESNALHKIRNSIVDPQAKRTKVVLDTAKKILGKKRYTILSRKVSEL